jgi:hypothetical protein
LPGFDILNQQIEKKCGFSDAGFSDNINVLAPIRTTKAKGLLPSPNLTIADFDGVILVHDPGASPAPPEVVRRVVMLDEVPRSAAGVNGRQKRSGWHTLCFVRAGRVTELGSKPGVSRQSFWRRLYHSLARD